LDYRYHPLFHVLHIARYQILRVLSWRRCVSGLSFFAWPAPLPAWSVPCPWGTWPHRDRQSNCRVVRPRPSLPKHHVRMPCGVWSV